MFESIDDKFDKKDSDRACHAKVHRFGKSIECHSKHSGYPEKDGPHFLSYFLALTAPIRSIVILLCPFFSMIKRSKKWINSYPRNLLYTIDC